MATTNTTGSAPATTTFNTDVHSIVRRYNRFIVELLKSQSSSISQTMPFDVTRFTSYLDNMEAYLGFIVSQPLLDCPETGPTEIALPTNPAMPYIENESSYDLMQMLSIARDEIAGSQSSRIPTNLMQFDYKRQLDYITKMRNMMAFIAKSEPLDLPESSPMDGVSGRGQQGV